MEREHGRLFRLYLEEYARAGGKKQPAVRALRNESTRQLVARALGREDGLTGKPVAAVDALIDRVNKKCGVPWRDAIQDRREVMTQKRAKELVETAESLVREVLTGAAADADERNRALLELTEDAERLAEYGSPKKRE